jgi:hypothetical protein
MLLARRRLEHLLTYARQRNHLFLLQILLQRKFTHLPAGGPILEILINFLFLLNKAHGYYVVCFCDSCGTKSCVFSEDKIVSSLSL